jgi:alpha/beta superfamily hydrolase
VRAGDPPEIERVALASADGVTLDGAWHAAIAPRRGCLVAAHGITADLDEDGTFVTLGALAARSGVDTLRFSFRGHGRSGGTPRGVTIAGEMLDLGAALDYAAERARGAPLAILAASFAAVPTCLSLRFIEPRLAALVLWNPVLNLVRTFIEPELPWAQQSFNERGRQQLAEHDYLELDGFQIGRVLYEEMQMYEPYSRFVASQLPAMIVQGDADTYVSHAIASRAAREHAPCEMLTMIGSEHGFHARRAEVILATVEWLERNVLASSPTAHGS